jgi:uncharacterized DUF497 family protein
VTNLFTFEWSEEKEKDNLERHGVSFSEAQEAFYDPGRIITVDAKHSHKEERFFCLGKVNDRVLTVRFTLRGQKIRIIGTGYWRKGRKYYEKNTTG